MKKSAALIPVIALLVAGGGFAWYDGVASKRPAPAEAAEKPKTNCTLSLTSSQTAGNIGFAVSPAVEDAVYNWTLSAGSISSGQGTPNILVSTQGVTHAPVTATVVALDHDASCPAGSNTVSMTATQKAE